MASPASSQRRRANIKRQPLSRTNTLFSAIKNIVTAPLSWFASTDDFEDVRDGMGKRRRLAAAPTEPILDEGDGAPRNKRMRVDSPPRGLRREGAYLDPPSTAFQQPPSVGRSVSTGSQTASYLFAGKISGSHVRSTISPLRNLSISRTMSVDPPLRPQSREGGVLQSQRPLAGRQDADASMESIHSIPQLSAPSVSSFPRTSLSMPRDLSTSHSRPPFRMRTSLTPQPAQIQRERSEPPPLQLLRTHPTFVKPPLEEGARASSHEPTLGSLVESVRRTESPARQHGSLLFGGRTQAELKPDVTRAQRALHELEIYKTPLLPTRLRNGATQASITGVPDLFKPRRNKLLLMKDEKQTSDRKLGQKEATLPDKNGTKPYAGAGDMKRMLVKRKLELEDEQKDLEEISEEINKEEDVIVEEEKADLQPPTSSKEIPPPPKDDWYSLATGSSSAVGGSSLRVGRAKSSRNHISRPTARSRTKFSAAFDDDGDDTMVEQDKERIMLEEAAKKAPVFDIPSGFSFSKDVKPIEHDTTNAKEPPIKSLPFSLSAAPTAALAPTPEKSGAPISAPQPAFSAPPTTSLPFSFEALPTAVNQDKPSLEPLSEAQQSENSTGVPNFFARSAAFNKPLEIKTPPLTFSSPVVEPVRPNAPAPFPVPTFSFTAPSGDGTPDLRSATTSHFGSPAPVVPVKDLANPFWDGERQRTGGGSPTDFRGNQPQLAPISIFGEATQEKPVVPRQPSATQTKVDIAPVSKLFGDPKKIESTVSPLFPDGSITKAPAFKFDSTPGMSLFGNKSTTETSSVPAKTTPLPLGRESPAPAAPANASSLVPSASSSLFGGSDAAVAFKAPTSLFGTISNPTTDAEKPSFSFAQPTSVQAPKPVSNNPFTFNATSDSETKTSSPTPFPFTGSGNKETKSVSPAPFTFGAPSTPVATEKATTPFTFGAPASPVPLSIFSFGSGGNAPSDVSKPLQTERPVTPPKNAEQEFKMEESPTREIQQPNGNNKPAFGGFTFGNPPTTSSVLFGGPSSAPPTTTPFPFGSSLSNPFGPQPIKETKSEEPKPFSFVQSSSPATNTGFPFGQNQPTDSPRPSTTGSFNFGASSSGGGGGGGGGGGTPTSTTSGFNFGATPTSNPFGQPTGGSAPSSPSAFQPSVFNFGAPSSGASFSFGSQPASPATGNTNLPQATTPGTFGSANTGFGSSAPSSPFSAPTQIAPSTSSGGTLFTIGAAPPQGRAIKKLPRGRAKR